MSFSTTYLTCLIIGSSLLLSSCKNRPPAEQSASASEEEVSSTNQQVAANQQVYPQGKAFPFMGYSGVPARDAVFGFSVAGPSYGKQEAPLRHAQEAGLPYPYLISIKMDFLSKKPLRLSEKEIHDQITKQVKAVVDNQSICWWYLGPEELRHWRKNEMDYLRIATAAIRAADPHNRPIWMYEPNHRNAASLTETGKYQDIIGKGFYCNLAGFQNSRVWIKWSMQQQTEAAAALEKADGRKRTPLVMPELCADPKDPAHDHLIPKWTRHDVYLGLMCGGKGVAIWSLFPRREVSRTWQLWYDSYAHLANELTGSRKLGQVFLHGKKTNKYPLSILSGPKEIAMVKGSKNNLESRTSSEDEMKEKALKFPALTVSEYHYEGSTYVFICNSSSSDTIKFQSTKYAKDAIVREMFSMKRHYDKNHHLYGWLGPLQVRCYKIDIPNN
ncbi:MAG: hypothetical protein ACPG6P_00940 [Akkermansiaceae bacterium]